MADTFDPDAFLKGTEPSNNFDPDAFLAGKEVPSSLAGTALGDEIARNAGSPSNETYSFPWVTSDRRREQNSQFVNELGNIVAGDIISGAVGSGLQGLGVAHRGWANAIDREREIVRRVKAGQSREEAEAAVNASPPETTPTTEHPLYRAGEAVKKYAQETFPASQETRESLPGQIAGIAGGMAPAVLGTVTLGPVGALAGAAQFGLSSAGDTFEKAIQKGASEEDAARAAGISGEVSAAIGILPLGVVLAPIKQTIPGLTGWAAAKLAQAAANGVTFSTVGEAQNYIESEVAKAYYDPNAQYSTDIKRIMASAIVGGGLGAHHAVQPTERLAAARDLVGAAQRELARSRPETPAEAPTPPPEIVPPEKTQASFDREDGSRLISPEVPHNAERTQLGDSVGAQRAQTVVDQMSPETKKFWGEQLRSQFPNEDVMLDELDSSSKHESTMEISDYLKNVFSALVGLPSKATNEIKRFLDWRHGQEGTERINGILDRYFGRRLNETEWENQVKAARAREASPAYEAFKNTQIPLTPELENVLKRPGMKRAMNKANEQLLNSGRPITNGFEDELGALNQVPTAEAFQLAKESLDDKIKSSIRAGKNNQARYLLALKNDLVNAIDNHPDPSVAGLWKEARDRYIPHSRILKAYELGKNLLTGKIHETEVAYLVDAMGEPEKQALLSGLREYYATVGGRAGSRSRLDLIQKSLGESNKVKLTDALGEEKANSLINEMEAERRMHFASADIAKNSATQRRLEYGKLFKPGSDTVSNILSALPQAVGFALSGGKHLLVSGAIKGIKSIVARRKAQQEATLQKIMDESGLFATLQGPERDAAFLALFRNNGSGTVQPREGGAPPRPTTGPAGGPPPSRPSLTIETLPQQLLMNARAAGTFEAPISRFHQAEKEMLAEAGIYPETLDDGTQVYNIEPLIREAERRQDAGLIDNSIDQYNSQHIADWESKKADTDLKPPSRDDYVGQAMRGPALPTSPLTSADESHIVNPVSGTPQEKVAQLVKLTEENKPIVQSLIKEIDDRFGTESKDNVKKPENILSKSTRPSILAKKPWFDVEHIRDSYRFKTVLNSLHDVPDIVQMLKDKGIEIVKSDTLKQFHPLEWGWRISAFDLRMPNGQLVEYYLPVKEMEAAKDAGHKIFEKWRNDNPKNFTPEQLTEYRKDLRRSRRLYQEGWDAYLDRSGDDESALQASLSRVSASPSGTSAKVPLNTSSAGNAMPFSQRPETSEAAQPSARINTSPSSFIPTSTPDMAPSADSVGGYGTNRKPESESFAGAMGLIGAELPGLRPHRVSTADGTAVDVAPIVVEADQLRTSQDPGYDRSLQPRQRSRAASQAQVRDIASNLDPERLGYSAEADRGAPIVGPDGMVESGNGRVLALRNVYSQNTDKAQAYRDWLARQGVDVSKYRNPILVRQRLTPMSPEERQAFTAAANQASTLAMSATERARADAKLIDDKTLRLLTNPNDIGANRDFVRRFVRELPQAEQGALMDAYGALSAEGLTRIRNALFAKAYDDVGALARLAESTDDDVRSISNALAGVAPRWAQLRADVAAGRVRPDMDVTPDLMEAVKRTAKIRGEGTKFDKYLAQSDAFNPISDIVEGFMRAFYDPQGRRALGSKRISDALAFYADEARKASAEKGLDLGLVPVEPRDIQKIARDKGWEGYGEEISDRGGAGNGEGVQAPSGQIRGQGPREGSNGPQQAGGEGGEGPQARARQVTDRDVRGRPLRTEPFRGIGSEERILEAGERRLGEGPRVVSPEQQEAILRKNWQEHGPELDWDFNDWKPWDREVTLWNRRHPDNPMPVGSEPYTFRDNPEFERMFDEKYLRGRREPFPGIKKANEYFQDDRPDLTAYTSMKQVPDDMRPELMQAKKRSTPGQEDLFGGNPHKEVGAAKVEEGKRTQNAFPGKVSDAPIHEPIKQTKSNKQPSLFEWEVPSERAEPKNDGTGALEQVAPREGAPTQGRGAARPRTPSGGKLGAAGNRDPYEEGLFGRRSEGSGAPAIHPYAPGERELGPDTRTTEGVGGEESGISQAPAAVDVKPSEAPSVPAVDYRITDETELGKGPEGVKFKDNIAAIETLKKLEREDRRPTPQEQRILARYVGWGGMANAFSLGGKFKPDWEARGRQLEGLLSKEELAAARHSTPNAHYTSRPVVDAMWRIAERLGFKGGLALETSMGTGNFIGLTPERIAGQTKFVGVELDSITARIAKALYPQQTIINSGFQRVPLPDGEFTLNIGNPPFGSESLRFQNKPDLAGLSIHNQFFLAGLDALQPGGLHVGVVSRYLLDAQDNTAREKMAIKANLLGAIRLPDTAFKENARTEVVTDIVVMQRRTPEEQRRMEDIVARMNKSGKGKEAEQERRDARREFDQEAPWVNTAQVRDPLGGEPMTVNSYFGQRPDMIVGRLERSGTMRTHDEVNVKLDKSQDFNKLLNDAVDRLPKDKLNLGNEIIDRSIERSKTLSDSLRISMEGNEPGHIEHRDGKLTQIMERETPNGDFELVRRPVDKDTPWSKQLSMDNSGRWFTLEPKVDDKGKKVKQGNRLVYERRFFPDNKVPANMRLGKERFDNLSAVSRMRDLLKRQIVMETEDAPSSDMERNRGQLAAAYRDYTKKYGLLNDPSNLRLLNEMPDGPLLMSLESGYRDAITDEKAARTGQKARPASADPAEILSRRVIQKYSPPDTASSPAEAMAISLSERGRIDVPRVAELLKIPEEKVRELFTEGDKPVAFLDPETNQLEPAHLYLSGQVRRKLAAARLSGLDRNVKALEEVQPAEWQADQVTPLIGSNWIPTKVYEDFAKHLLGVDKATVNYSKATNAFNFLTSEYGEAKHAEWGTPDIPPDSILRGLLNSRLPKVIRETGDDPPKRYEDKDASALVALKAKEIENAFGDWVFSDRDRRRELVKIYNDKFNTRKPRQHDGSYLTLPGKNPEIGLRRHSLNGIARGIYERNMMFDWVVGSGKTFGGIGRIMERRRLGLSNKPMVVVPNHLVSQWASDFLRLYPGAKILAAGNNQFTKQNRRRLFAKIATGDWDAVIVPHSSFGFIGISPETELRFLDDQLRVAKDAVAEAEEEAAASGLGGGFRKPYTVKEAERLVSNIESRMDAIRGKRRDGMLTFEQMGVDDLTVDECFPYDTPILTDSGWTPIGDIVERRLPVKVLSYNSQTLALEWKPVVNWFSMSAKKTIVKVNHGCGYFTCTADHKIWTKRGYVEAQALLSSDQVFTVQCSIRSDRNSGKDVSRLFANNQDLRTMPSAVQLSKQGTQEQFEAQVLSEQLCGKLEECPTGSQRIVQCLDGRSSWGFITRPQIAEDVGTYAYSQPNEKSDGCRKDAAENVGTHIFGERRELKDNGTSTYSFGSAGIADGVCHPDSTGTAYVSEPAELLQGGFGITTESSGDRNRRALPQEQKVEISGPAQNGSLECSWVVSVEILEPRDNGQPGSSHRIYPTVYDIETADNHNFFAAGVLVSNSHEFKNLFYSSRMTGVRGMGDKSGSQKAFDLYNKIKVLDDSPNGSTAFLTGTPISNSAVEMFTMMRYLAAKELRELGMENFDAWRSQFVSAEPKWEPTESGGLKEVTRLGRSWSNMRALMDLYHSFTDSVTQEDINRWYAEDNKGAEFPIPKVAGGERQTHVVQPTPAQQAILKDVLAGFDGLPGIKDPDERNAERLRLMDRARKVSLDARAVDPRNQSKEEGGKLESISSEVARIYKKWDSDKGTQLIFLDRSVPKSSGDDKVIKAYDEAVAKRDKALADHDETAFRLANEALEKFDPNEISELRAAQQGGWTAYQQIKDNLVKQGIPADEIRFVQEANNDAEKKRLFDAVNDGEVRVLIGSSQRMGAGTNVQKRIVAIHHGDVTWKPSDIEQREGRGIRQGNSLYDKYPGFELEIHNYVTERTIDAKMWDLNAEKLRMVNGIRKYDGSFNMDFADEDSVGMAEIAALASGDPLLMERVKLSGEIEKLEMQDRGFQRKMNGIEDAIDTAHQIIRDYPEKIKEAKEKSDDMRRRIADRDKEVQSRSVTIDGKPYKNSYNASEAVDRLIEESKNAGNARYKINVNGRELTSKEAISSEIGLSLGDTDPFEATIGGEVYRKRWGAVSAISDKLKPAVSNLTESKTVYLGKMFGADFEATVDPYSASDVRLTLALVDGGNTIAAAQGVVEVSKPTSLSVLQSLERDVLGVASSRGDFMQDRLDRAKKAIPELTPQLKKEFPVAGKLAELRDRLRGVIETLSQRDKKHPEPQETETEHEAAERQPMARKVVKRDASGRPLKTEPIRSEASERLLQHLIKGWSDDGIVAYHGSPHKFTRFDSSKIGSGEGAQAYGRGLYLAENERVAEEYKKALSPPGTTLYNGNPLDTSHPDLSPRQAQLAWDIGKSAKNQFNGDFTAAKKYWENRMHPSSGDAELIKSIDPSKMSLVLPGGKMYQVNISAHPEHFLEWDKPLSKQNEVVKGKLAQIDLSGGRGVMEPLDYYLKYPANAHLFVQRMSAEFGEAGASQRLRNAGIPGIKYLDQGSRKAEGQTYNYVVFNDKDLTIRKRYASGGRVEANGKKITRDAFLYMEDPDNARFAQCGTCWLFRAGKKRCAILPDNFVVTANDSCGYYLEGTPLS